MTIAIKGWEAIDEALAAVQRDFPLAGRALGTIRGDLTAMRYVLGTEPEVEADPIQQAWKRALAEPKATGRREVGKQQQSVSDALTFEPTTHQAARTVVTDVRLMGFTGSFCPDCGGSRMVRAGTCEHCSECGATTGCS